MQFFRNLGGTIATAVLGSILANRLSANIQGQVDGLHLPKAILSAIPLASGNARQIFDPAVLAARRASLPQAAQPLFDKIIGAVREGLAVTLHEMFLFGLAAVGLALIASVFLKEVPLTRVSRGMGGEGSPVPETEEEFEEGHPQAATG